MLRKCQKNQPGKSETLIAFHLLFRQRKSNRLTPNLEGGLVGCLAMVRHVVPHLTSDSTLMNELSDSLLARVIFPALHIATSSSLTFASATTSHPPQVATSERQETIAQLSHL